MAAPSPVDRGLEILRAIAAVGRRYPGNPGAANMEPFRSYFRGGSLVARGLDERDGGVTRREAMLRFLLLLAVLDQGPDIAGLRELVAQTASRLYREEIRIFHRPLDFFREVNVSVEQIEAVHEIVKRSMSAAWARRTGNRASGYLLYLDNAKQTLGYAIPRWGTPLALAYLLEKKSRGGIARASALTRYLKSFKSAEDMRRAVKSHETYGLGKMIGDKAAHLFAKWVIHAYPLLKDAARPEWDAWSYELPMDSNLGRVLYRTGFWGLWMLPRDFRKGGESAPFRRGGKNGQLHFRVTNLRGKRSRIAARYPAMATAYRELCRTHLRQGSPSKIQMQRIPSALGLIGRDFTPGEVDDGAIKIGTTWCFNVTKPLCGTCPVRGVCGGVSDRDLITKVFT